MSSKLVWQRSSFCNADGCVEVAKADSTVFVRDSKLGDDSPVLVFTEDEWRVFRAGMVSGEF